MIRAFIIEFTYNGKPEFANVVEYKHSPSVFYITPVKKEYSPDLPPLVLRTVGENLVPNEDATPEDKVLLEAVAGKIKEFITRNPAS